MIFNIIEFVPHFPLIRNRQYIAVFSLELHFLIDLIFFRLWDSGIPHEHVLLSEVYIVLIEFSIVVPQQTFQVVGGEFLLLIVSLVICVESW